MNQSRLESLTEVAVNIVIGYAISFVGQMVIFPGVGLDVSLSQNLLIGLFFTVLSIARQYVIRRWFNKGLNRASMSIARNLHRRFFA